jgi:restriction system protein
MGDLMYNRRSSKRSSNQSKDPFNIVAGLVLLVVFLSSDIGAFLFVLLFKLLVIAAFIYFIYRFLKGKTVPRQVKDLNEVDKMSGLEFEQFLVPLFEKLGYQAHVTKGSGDFGADLVLHRKHKKIVVQAKRYSKTIGVSAIQEIVAAKGYYNASGAMVVTNNYFTPAAENLAQANKVRLLDRDELIYMMNNDIKTSSRVVPSLRRYLSKQE